jgi:hypothetical protein
MISHSATRMLSPRRSSTLYDEYKPRLRLGRGKLASTRADQDKPKLLKEEAKRPGVNSPARPRGGSPDKAPRLSFNAPRRIVTYDKTCQLPSTITLFLLPLVPLPLRL